MALIQEHALVIYEHIERLHKLLNCSCMTMNKDTNQPKRA